MVNRGDMVGRLHWRLCHGARNELADIMGLTSPSMASLSHQRRGLPLPLACFEDRATVRVVRRRAVRLRTRSGGNLVVLVVRAASSPMIGRAAPGEYATTGLAAVFV